MSWTEAWLGWSVEGYAKVTTTSEALRRRRLEAEGIIGRGDMSTRDQLDTKIIVNHE
jgi:hypothetical protein